ncbi:MAG: DUF6998 domain-containing protein [Patiriisocius sp.]|uniref:DUF6998 domain-containing protein n=1 Tax=Patiriisocius sp. TaxID=2822396 RepID=UPI003EF7DF3A
MEEIEQLLAIAESLRNQYNRGFSIDGNIVGDIGEVLAQQKYDLELYDANHPIHDGYTPNGQKVQIRATLKNKCYLSIRENNRPDYFLFIHIESNGEIDEIYNGPAHYVYNEYKTYGKTDEQIALLNDAQRVINGNAAGYAKISSNRLRLMNTNVDINEKIEERA